MPTKKEREAAAEKEKARRTEAARARPLPVDIDPAIQTDDGHVIIDPEAAFAGTTQPTSAAQLQEFGALEEQKPTPFTRDGRDYYVDPGGGLHSVVAGFDAATEYPGLLPATAEQVRARDIQKRSGSGMDQLSTFVESGAATLGQTAQGIHEVATLHDPRYELDPRDPAAGILQGEDVFPFAYTDEAVERREANPKSALAGALAADVGSALLTRKLPLPKGASAAAVESAELGHSFRSAIAGGLTGAGSDAALTGEPFSIGDAGMYAMGAGILDGVSGFAWGEAMRALGKKKSVVDLAVDQARKAGVEGALHETDPVRRAAALRDNAEALYERHQGELDDALDVIAERTVSAPERMFTPGVLKRTVNPKNEAAQADKLLELAVKADQAVQVVTPGGDRTQAFERAVLPEYGPVPQAPAALQSAADILENALGQQGPGMFGALREARAALLADMPDSPLARELLEGIEATLQDEPLWGRAAKNHATYAKPPEFGAVPVPLSELGTNAAAREAIEQRIAAARQVASHTGDKKLMRAVEAAERAVASGDAVTGARLMGPVKTAAAKALKSKGTQMIAEQFGKLTGGLIGGALGGIPGVIGGTIAGDIASHFAAPYVGRAVDKLTGVAKRNAGKLTALGVVGAGALGAMGDDTEGAAEAGLGLLALPLLLRGGSKVTLGELLRDFRSGIEKETARKGRSVYGWEEKQRVFDALGVEDSPLRDLIASADDSLEGRRLSLDAPEDQIEDALRANYYFENRLRLARSDFQSEARKATTTANRRAKPSVIEARKLLGRVGDSIEDNFTGEWTRDDFHDYGKRFTYTGDTADQVIKKRLKDKAPLTLAELGDELAPGVLRDRQSFGVPSPEFVYPQTPEYLKARKAWSDAAHAFHEETRQLRRAEFAPLQAKIDEATAALEESDRIGRTAAEDGIIRSTLREALGMKAPKPRELATNIDAGSRYRKLKKGFTHWTGTALNDEQRRALRYWQSHEYRAINALAREGQEAATEESRRLAKMYKDRYAGSVKDIDKETAEIAARTQALAPELIDVMNHAIEQGYSVPGRVTRGISMPADEVERLLAADTVTSQGFMSTSINPEVPEGFATRRAGEFKEVPVILTIEQKTGVPIGQGEGEVTLRPGTQFSVEWASRMKDGSVHAYLKEAEPSKLTKADMLRGIARSIPTEAKVAGGLLAVDAATRDEDDPGYSAAGVGALALLFGGARKLRGINSRLSVLEQRLGPLAAHVDRTLAENEKTIRSIAEWGKTAERQFFQNAVRDLKAFVTSKLEHNFDLKESFQKLIDSGQAPFGAENIYEYANARIEKALAEAAGAGQLGARVAAPNVQKVIEAERGKVNPLASHGMNEFLPMTDGTASLYYAQFNATREALNDKSPQLAADLDRRLVLEQARQFVQAAIDHKYDAQSVREQFQQRVKNLSERWFNDLRPEGAGPVLPEEHSMIESGVKYGIAGAWEEALSKAELADGGKVPGRGLEVRSALRSFVENPDDIEGLMVKTDSALEDTNYKKQVYQSIVDRLRTTTSMSTPARMAVATDIVDAMASGRPLASAVDDVAHTLDEAGGAVPLTQLDHRKAKDAFDRWELAASQRAGFSINQSLEDFAGDWDYKNINAYARGSLTEGKTPIAKMVLDEIEMGNVPSDGQLNKLMTAADAAEDHEVSHWAFEVLAKGDDESVQALFHALKDGPMDGGPSVSVEDVRRSQKKATDLQHALDLAVSDGYAAPGITYRAILLSPEDIRKIEQAGEVEAHGFMSTSADANYTLRFVERKEMRKGNPSLQPVIFEVHQRTGVPVNPSEDEFLLRSGTRFTVEPIQDPRHVAGNMSDRTRDHVKFRIVETDHEPKLPNKLNVKSALPWVAGGVLGIGAATQANDASAAEPTGEVIPTEAPEDPAAVVERDATRRKLEYLQTQSRSTITGTARALTSPTQKLRTVPVTSGITQSVGVSGFVGNSGSVRAAYEQKREMLQKLQTDPMALVEEMADGLSDIGDAAPDTHRQIVAKTFEIVRYLQSKLPGTIGPSLVRPEGSPISDIALRQFALYYSAATNPSSVYADLANNRARKEQIEALQTVWPDLYTGLKAEIVSQLAEGRPTLAQRTRLGTLFDFGDVLDRAFSWRMVSAHGQYVASQAPQMGPGGAPGGPQKAAPTRRTQPSITGSSATASLQRGAASPV